MFDVSSSEFLVIVLVALIVFGPKRLPDMFRKLGRMYAEFQRATGELRAGLESEISQARRPLDEVAGDVRRTVGEAASELRAGLEQANPAPSAEVDPGPDEATGTGTRNEPE